MLETIIALHILGTVVSHAVAPLALPLGVQIAAEVSDSPHLKRFAERARQEVDYGEIE